MTCAMSVAADHGRQRHQRGAVAGDTCSRILLRLGPLEGKSEKFFQPSVTTRQIGRAFQEITAAGLDRRQQIVIACAFRTPDLRDERCIEITPDVDGVASHRHLIQHGENVLYWWIPISLTVESAGQFVAHCPGQCQWSQPDLRDTDVRLPCTHRERGLRIHFEPERSSLGAPWIADRCAANLPVADLHIPVDRELRSRNEPRNQKLQISRCQRELDRASIN